jgi:hypothetical protein
MKTILIRMPDDVYAKLRRHTLTCAMSHDEYGAIHDFAAGVVAAVDAGESEKTFALVQTVGGSKEPQ